MRRLTALLAAILLAAMIAAPAQAATVQRIFTASMGGGSYGTVRITVYTDGSGRADYALKGLKKGASYRMEVHRNSCANLGTVVTRYIEGSGGRGEGAEDEGQEAGDQSDDLYNL